MPIDPAVHPEAATEVTAAGAELIVKTTITTSFPEVVAKLPLGCGEAAPLQTIDGEVSSAGALEVNTGVAAPDTEGAESGTGTDAPCPMDPEAGAPTTTFDPLTETDIAGLEDPGAELVGPRLVPAVAAGAERLIVPADAVVAWAAAGTIGVSAAEPSMIIETMTTSPTAL